jgi:hypothetical protein
MSGSHIQHKRTFSTNGLQRLYVFLIVLIFVGGAVLVARKFFAPCKRLSCLRLPKNTQLKLVEVYEETTGSVYRARYQMNDTIVRVDVRYGIDSDTALDYIHGRIAGMKALYDNIRSPYPGLLSNEIVCDKEFKPVFESVKTASGLSVEKIVGFLNERLTFGSCIQDQAVYKGAMVLFACPSQKQLYQIELISKNVVYAQDKVDSFIRSIRCK